MQACVDAFSPFFAPGGWMALGGKYPSASDNICKLAFNVVVFAPAAGSYHFAKEIPMFTDYEIHISIGGFEEKWVS